MLRLRNSFSIYGLAFVLIAALSLSLFAQYAIDQMLLKHGEDENLAEAEVISLFWKNDLQQLATSTSPEIENQARQKLNEKIRQHSLGHSIVRIAIKTPDGKLLFSTSPDSQDSLSATQVLAPEKRHYSEIQFHKSFHGMHAPISDAAVVFSQIALSHNDNTATLELHNDISALYEIAQTYRWQVITAIIAVLFGLYLILTFIVRRINKELVNNQQQLESSLEQLEATRMNLEKRVKERTEVLQNEILERQTIEDNLTVQKHYLDAVMENVFNGIICINRFGIIESFNSTAEFMFGYKANEIIGQNISALMPKNHSAAHDGYLNNYLKTGERSIIGNLRQLNARRRDGSLFPIELAVTEARIGEMPVFIGTIRDLSKQRVAELELESARNKYQHREKMAAIGNLAAGIVHEIGNPIAAISGLIQGIYDQRSLNSNSTDSGDDLKLIQEQIDRIVNISRDVSEFSTPQSHTAELNDLNNLIGRTCRLMRHDARFNQIKVELELDNQIPAIFCSSDHIIQILMNLLSNSADAISEKNINEGHIRVLSALHQDKVCMSVIDNGCGMATDVLRHATEAFYSTKSVGKGTGLGLSLCHSLLEADGGEMIIDSSTEQGTRIDIYLPNTEQPLQQAAEY
ncbi:MAG: PAS domain S-box protein [Motiliproteus sp.]